MADTNTDLELKAMQEVIAALTPLDAEARSRVLDYVFKRLGFLAVDTQKDSTQPVISIPEAQLPKTEESRLKQIVDIRSLTLKKAPKTANEMAAIVAYYLSELAPTEERKTEITAADLDRYFKQAGFRLPKKARFTLVNAKYAGYLDTGSKSGGYKLNPVGYNLVTHGLPSSKTASRASTPRRKQLKRGEIKKKSSNIEKDKSAGKKKGAMKK